MREYRELRNSSEDAYRAAPYVGVARTLLGALKNRMVLGGIRQGKDVQRLADGTIITVHSIFGQDTIDIQVPDQFVHVSFRYEFVTVTDIGVDIKFNKTQYEIKANNSRAIPITDFTVINNDNSTPSFPVYSQYQNVWHHKKGDADRFNIVTAGAGVVRYSVDGNRTSARTFWSILPSYITPENGQQYAPAGAFVNAAAKQGEYIVGVTATGDVIAWKVGDPTYQSVAITMPSWVDAPQSTFWSFNKEGTKAISTVYEAGVPISGGISWPLGATEWKASGYVELDITVSDLGVLSASVGRTKQASTDMRPIIAVDYDYTVTDSDQIIYLTIEAFDDGDFYTVYLRAYSAEQKVNEFFVEASDTNYFWEGSLIAMDLRYRAYTWGYGQIPSDGDTFGSDWTGAVVRMDIDGDTGTASELYSTAGSHEVTLPVGLGVDTEFFGSLERAERAVIKHVPMSSAYAVSVHPEGAWGVYAEFDHVDAPEKLYTDLDVVHLPSKPGGQVIETSHRSLYDSARVADPLLPAIIDGTNYVAMGAASVWVQIEGIS